jgi:hypothetical protein
MKWLSGLFGGKKKELSPPQRVREIMRLFVETSLLLVDGENLETPEDGQLYLTYMFGAVDALGQLHELDESSTVSLYQNLLEDFMGEYSPDEANELTQATLRHSITPDGQNIMSEGGNAVMKTLAGDQNASLRLFELLGGWDDSDG